MALVGPFVTAVLVALAMPTHRRILVAFMSKPPGQASGRDLVPLLPFDLWLAISMIVLLEPPRTVGGLVISWVMVGVGVAAFAFLRRTAPNVTSMPRLAESDRAQVREATRRGVRLEDPALAAEAAQLARGMCAWRTVVLASAFVVFGVLLLVLATTPDLRRHGWPWLVLIAGFLLIATPFAIRLRKALRAWRVNQR